MTRYMPNETKVKVARTGGSLRMTIPHSIVQDLKIKEGDPLFVSVIGERVLVRVPKRQS